jgi:hypothetical protein
MALPVQSKSGRLADVGAYRARAVSTSSSETATTGRLAANTARHPKRSVTSPPTSGPMAAARPMHAPNSPNTRARRSAAV